LDQGFFDPCFVYPMNRIIFQPDRTPRIPIFHHSIIPSFHYPRTHDSNIPYGAYVLPYGPEANWGEGPYES